MLKDGEIYVSRRNDNKYLLREEGNGIWSLYWCTVKEYSCNESEMISLLKDRFWKW